MSSSFRIVFYILMFPLLMLFTPALHAQAPNQSSPQNLTCSPAPCVFPNVMVSGGGYAIFSNVIAANPGNPAQMLVGALDPNCTYDEGIFSTEDAGTTWGHTCLPAHSNSFGGGSPLLAYGLNGVAYAGTDTTRNEYPYQRQVLISSSTDNGKTWRTPGLVLTAFSAYATRLEIDNSPASPFQNSLYISGGIDESQIIVSHSNDGAKTWSTTAVDRISGLLLDYYPDLALGADGTVFATWLLCKPKPPGYSCADNLAHMMLSKSTDGGNTWTAPVEIAQAVLTPDSGINWTWGTLPGTVLPMSNTPVVAVDNSSGPNAGNVYVSFYNYNGHYMQVGVVTSKDGGQTWSVPVRVSNSSNGDEFFQWVSVAADGTIGVTWLDTRNADHVLYQPYFAISTDGGATFTGDHPLANGLSNPLKNPFTTFIGDFRTSVWVGTALYAVWQDNHVGNFQVAIGGAQF